MRRSSEICGPWIHVAVTLRQGFGEGAHPERHAHRIRQMGIRGDGGLAELRTPQFDPRERAEVAHLRGLLEGPRLVAPAAQQHEPGRLEYRTSAESDGMPISHFDRDAGAGGKERGQSRRLRHQRDHALRQFWNTEDVAAHGPFVECALRRPLAHRHLALDARTNEVVDEGGTEASLGDDDARPGVVLRRRVDVRHQPEQQRLETDRLVRLVHLGESVVVEHERRVGRDQLRRVVTERRAGISVLDEMTRRASEREAADEARRLRDAVHAVTGLCCERKRQLARAELAANELDLERRHQVFEGVLARVDAEPRDEPIQRGEQNEPLRAEGDAFPLQAEAWSPQARLMQCDAFEHLEGPSIPACSPPVARA